MSPGLRGARVVLTRAQEDLEELAASVRTQGGEPLPLPCLTFTDPTDPGPALALLDRLVRGEKPDALALASPQSVRRLAGALRILLKALSGLLNRSASYIIHCLTSIARIHRH